jgi:hypothetical protein
VIGWAVSASTKRETALVDVALDEAKRQDEQDQKAGKRRRREPKPVYVTGVFPRQGYLVVHDGDPAKCRVVLFDQLFSADGEETSDLSLAVAATAELAKNFYITIDFDACAEQVLH